MDYPRIVIWGFLFCAGIFQPVLTTHAYGIENSGQPEKAGQQDEKAADPFTLRIAVEEVRVDAVVFDKNNKQVTSLTKDDFEIRQDDKPQKITSCVYINDYQPETKKQGDAVTESKAISPLPTPVPARNEVRRTIVFLVDDLSMLFKQVHYARMALRKFVETQMQTGDIVAILQTSRGNAALQALTADKRQLMTIINSIQWSIKNEDLSEGEFQAPQSNFQALSYCIRALHDMPGRKFLICLSTKGTPGDLTLADAAWRAGVVIHELNIRGLTYGLLLDAESSYQNNASARILRHPNTINPYELADGFPGMDTYGRGTGNFGLLSDNMREIMQRLRNLSKPMGQMAFHTGGILVTEEPDERNSGGANFFLNGLGKSVEEEMKGYYLLSFIPSPGSSTRYDQRGYHSIKIKVKKPHQRVFTRSGYMSRMGFAETAATQTKNSLASAMFSPFKYNALNINLASGYVDNHSKGYLLRAWLQLDGRNLGFIDEKDGGRSISIEMAASITDIMGDIQDLGSRQLNFRVNDKDIALIQDQGFKFAISLPEKSPGNYYVRVAVKDQATGAIGSAYQLVEIPDLNDEKLNLSSIFIVNREEEAAWLLATTSREVQENSGSSSSITGRSQAFRSYLPGESFEYMVILYNAKSKQGAPPDLEIHFVLYRDGETIYTSPAEAVNPDGVSDLQRIPIRKKLQLESTLQPGDYILQIVATDKKADKKNRPATQMLPFEIKEHR